MTSPTPAPRYVPTGTVPPEVAEVITDLMALLGEALGIKGWFIAEDGDNESTVWRLDPTNPDRPIPVITESEAGAALWPVLVGLIPEMPESSDA